MAAVLCLVAAACSGASDPDGSVAETDERPPIILISLDTFRRDALGAEGPGGGTLTPHLDALGADSVTFTAARAQIPFTLASHMSMFTGLYPDVHGVAAEDRRLPERIATLPEILREVGYDTHGVVTNIWMKPVFGFGRGFDSYEKLDHGLTYAPRVTAQGLARLDEVLAAGGRPFLFLHYLDAHSDWKTAGNTLPYFAPEPYLQPFAGLDPADFCDAEGNCATDFMMEADAQRRSVEPQTIAAMRALYLLGIRYLDDELGLLFDALRERGLYDEALIIVVSDHGEEFREHAAFGHTQTYDECLAVPLLVKLPGNGGGGRKVDTPVQTVDLLPTVLDLIGLRPRTPVQGRSLATSLRGGGRATGPAGKPVALGQELDRPERFAFVRDGLKLIHDRSDGHTELYDLAADPGERRDLSEARPDQARALLDALLALLEENRGLREILAPEGAASFEGALTDEEIERLRALGYLR